MELKRVEAKCIKRYLDEDDIRLFEYGGIELDEVKVNKVGDTRMVIFEYCDEEYWEKV